MGSFPMTNPKKRPNHHTPTCQIKITSHKIPRLMGFKLACITIWPNKMSRRSISSVNHVHLMFLQTMLHKVWIVLMVVIYIKMILGYQIRIYIIRVPIKVKMIGNVDQNWNLIKVPMHQLYLILNCKGIIFYKINHRYNEPQLHRSQTQSELHVLPFSNKVIVHKILKLRLQICNELINKSNLVYKVQFLLWFSYH
jgi:hypothetical protein